MCDGVMPFVNGLGYYLCCEHCCVLREALSSSSSGLSHRMRHLRDGLCSGAIASTNDKTTHSLVTPMFFKARFCNVSREFLRLHHLGAVVWDDPSLKFHDVLKRRKIEKKVIPKVNTFPLLF